MDEACRICSHCRRSCRASGAPTSPTPPRINFHRMRWGRAERWIRLAASASIAAAVAELLASYFSHPFAHQLSSDAVGQSRAKARHLFSGCLFAKPSLFALTPWRIRRASAAPPALTPPRINFCRMRRGQGRVKTPCYSSGFSSTTPRRSTSVG